MTDLPKDSVCIIPARGGSKRIPRKNIRPFAGRPMIGYAIRAALQADVFARVIVSTDDDEIAAVAREQGAEVPFRRPPELADDHTVTSAVILHALRWLRAQGDTSEFACCMYPTAPFVRPEYIRKGHDLLREGRGDCAVSITTFPFPILRARTIKPDGTLAYHWPEYAKTRSQDLPEFYHDAGQFYWYRVETYLRENGNPQGGILPVLLPRCLVQDIDTPEDWERAEFMHAAMQARERAHA
jgi:N-acylneuraminate cytidylyltransferase